MIKDHFLCALTLLAALFNIILIELDAIASTAVRTSRASNTTDQLVFVMCTHDVLTRQANVHSFVDFEAGATRIASFIEITQVRIDTKFFTVDRFISTVAPCHADNKTVVLDSSSLDIEHHW